MAVVILDVDGVCADFLPTLLNDIHAAKTPEEITRHKDFFRHELTEGERARAFTLLEKSDWWQSLPTVPGSVRGVAELRSRKHDILWASSPWDSCWGWERARTLWLRKHYKANGFETAYLKSKHLLQGDYFVDDLPQNVESFQKTNPDARAVLFEHPYNATFEWPHRVSSWPQLLEFIP